MSYGFADRLRHGQELRRMRREHTIPGSPCERCRRDYCPQVCFPRQDWNKRHGEARTSQ